MGFLHKPHPIWWRQVMFQIHLWMGIALCLYMLVIGVTGSILVVEDEIENIFYHRLVNDPQGAGPVKTSASEVARIIHTTYPHWQLSVLYLPTEPGKNYLAFANFQKKFFRVYVSPTSGKIVGTVDPSSSWLSVVAGLHFRLLAGRTGLMLNGVGGICLLLLTASGIVIWWPGLHRWTRGLKVSVGKSWKRINFDLHSAIGFWCLAILSLWGVSAIYFAWSDQIEKFVSHFASTASLNPPVYKVPPRAKGTWPTLDSMIHEARTLAPEGTFTGIFYPDSDKDGLTLLMSRGDIRNFSKMDYLYFDPSTGRHLATWHRGQTDNWPSRFLFWLGPIHFGIDFGLAVKIIWAILGCALPLLSITGVVMYWNRSLSKKWKRLKGRRPAADVPGIAERESPVLDAQPLVFSQALEPEVILPDRRHTFAKRQGIQQER